MNKKKSIAIFTIACILLVLGMVFAFVPTFPIGKSMYDYTGYARSIKLGLDLAGGVSAVFDVKAPDGETLTADELKIRLDGVKASMEDLLTSKGYTESVVTYNTTGNPTITVEIPDVDDPERVFDLIGRPASLKITKGGDEKTVYIVGSKHLKNVGVAADTEKNNGTYVISLQFNAEGTKAFASATKENIGKSLDIYINGEKLMTVSVSSEISNGQAVIKQGSSSTTGGYTYEEAYDMATRLQAGTFGVDMTVRETNIVSPTLGTTAIRSSLIAGIVGIVLVMIFMVALYGMFGLMADMALLAYIELVLFLCSVLPWVQLTLPGIAGIIIGIGMAVDANVIIFARIREDLAAGMSVRGAIKSGFKKSLSAIIDGNVTTLIAAIVLGIIGTGPVRGFAVTLGIGIVLSMLTSLLVSRWVLLLLYNLGCRKQSLYGKAKEVRTLHVVAKRKIFFSISGLLIATGIAFMVVNGTNGKGIFNFDLEFSGGTSANITFNEEYSLEEVESKIIPLIKEATGSKTVQQQQVKGNNTIVFKTQMLDTEQRAALNAVLEDKFGIDTTDSDKVSYENISATVSSEMRRDAIIAIIVATVCMLIYIAIRFRDMKFATSAILALVHDVLFVLGYYAISRTSVGNTFIACILTIVGYSINATIVIFDRIRENMKVMQKESLAEVVNASITSTLSRSINTSLTTFIMVLILFILGVSSIREFAAPIMVGIVVGAYSSVCISGALWFSMKKASYKRALKKAEQ
mgnify:CR=1 FL=1